MDNDVMTAPDVQAALDQIGRTEDIRFAPSNRRVAFAGFGKDSIAIARVRVAKSATGSTAEVLGVVDYSSSELHYPHGVAFLDEDTIAVANRGGTLELFRLPSEDGRGELTRLLPTAGRGFEHLDHPGSLWIIADQGRFEVFVCNNKGPTLSRHIIEHVQDGSYEVTSNEILLRHWIGFPDGVAVDPDARWVAVSDHERQVVVLVDRLQLSDDTTKPQCILRGAWFPHGVHFTPDGRHLLVTDSGTPYLHVFQREGSSWSGVLYPKASIRVMDEETFQRGHWFRDVGGPKGIDIDRTGEVIAVTSELQPVAFFDVNQVVNESGPVGDDSQLRYELSVLSHWHDNDLLYKERISTIVQSRSFRLTAPLRRLNAFWARTRAGRSAPTRS